ncbi:MAG TPA: hemolysin III family protein [Patescibacteria group bacterium]
MKHKNIILLEEIFNSITHGIGSLLSILGLVLLIILVKDRSLVKIISFIIFGVSLCLMYLMSTLFHSLVFTKAKKVFQIFDTSSIFLLIAGTYTPLILLLLHGAFAWGLLVFIWGLAITGIVLNSIFSARFKILFTIVYLLMGWIGIITLQPIFTLWSSRQVMLLITGGILYTFGVFFYAWKRLPFNHTIWHIFVLGGSISHFLIIYSLS